MVPRALGLLAKLHVWLAAGPLEGGVLEQNEHLCKGLPLLHDYSADHLALISLSDQGLLFIVDL